MRWRLTLLISATVLLTACRDSVTSSASNDLTVLPVEYYSGSAVSGVEVVLLDAEGQKVDEQFSADGEVTFENLTKDAQYTVQIGEDVTMTTKDIVFDPFNATAVIETKAVQHTQALAVPIVQQLPELPHGCEITSLTAVLQYYGAPVGKKTMVGHMPAEEFKEINGQKFGPDPHLAYAGNPASPKGTYAFAEPIVAAAESYIKKTKLSLQAQNISRSKHAVIEQYIRQGVPVIAWVTLDLTAPKTKEGWTIAATKQNYTMFTNLHAVVIVDFRDGIVEVMDPLKGYVQYNEKTFFASYDALGQQAVIVY